MKFNWRLSRAAAVLREGGVITHATEAVFGIGAHAFEPEACARVAQLKSRIASQHFIVIGHSVEQLAALVYLKTSLRGDDPRLLARASYVDFTGASRHTDVAQWC